MKWTGAKKITLIMFLIFVSLSWLKDHRRHFLFYHSQKIKNQEYKSIDRQKYILEPQKFTDFSTNTGRFKLSQKTYCCSTNPRKGKRKYF